MPAKSHILTICTFRSQMEEFDFLYNEYEIKKKILNPGQIPEDLIKTCFLFISGRGTTHNQFTLAIKNNLIPWNCNKLLKFYILNFSFKQGCAFLIMQILFRRLGAERRKIILLTFSWYIIDEVWDIFFFKEIGCVCTLSNAGLIVGALW